MTALLRLLREFPDMDRNEQAGVIAGVCFLFGMPLCVGLAYLFGEFRIYGPAIRAWVHGVVGVALT